MTVVKWLEEFMNNGSQKSEGIISLAFAKAKKMELEQRKEDFRKGWKGNKNKDWNCEFYLIKHINNDFKSE